MKVLLTNAPQIWQIWLAYVRFADNPSIGKVRPIVILDHEDEHYIVAKITTALPSSKFSYCELVYWEDEGLLKPSRVQVSPLFRIAEVDIINDAPLGVLHEADRDALMDALQ
ncbi:MAG: hypothetical protein IJV62_01875 [Eggerthellaceae bacterium]|nr:hypothetical protein [Eggerthellaceae bacterium]